MIKLPARTAALLITVEPQAALGELSGRAGDRHLRLASGIRWARLGSSRLFRVHQSAGCCEDHEFAQFTSVHFGETLLLNGILPSIGTVGDAFDNAFAETTIGLYKHECVRADSPFRRSPRSLVGPGDGHRRLGPLAQHQRLMHHPGRRPPLEADAISTDRTRLNASASRATHIAQIIPPRAGRHYQHFLI
jgi:hypothetical protein